MQLFTWRIGQALALEGANIPSSNTDGIYALDIDLDLNEEIVARELEGLYISIEPEDMYLVSKDSNNRMEIVNGKVTSARGGSLTSWRGAQVSQSLSHPALVDRVLTDYLQHVDLYGPVNLDTIRHHLNEYINTVDMRRFVYMASWVMRSTSGSIFVDSNNNVHKGTIRTWLSHDGVTLTRYNTRSTPRGATTDAYAQELFPDSKFGNPEVIAHLAKLGALDGTFKNAITVQEYLEGDGERIPAIGETKISNLNPSTYLYVNNHAVIDMDDEEIEHIYSNIELEEYVALIAIFAEQWHNKIVP